jgi:Ca2+-binding EF-hand superfamily protein
MWFITVITNRLASLCNDLGSPLDYNTLESALLILDVNMDGKINYEEFIGWYKGSLR